MSENGIRAEIVAIGDELISGQRLDTNSQWLSQQLAEIGIPVAFHTTVGDQIDDNVDVFATAMRRADLVLVTGGLGPTADDLTRDALANVTGTELVLDESLLEHIRQMFEQRGRQMPERNRVQAMFPAGSRPIPNPHGTAPGVDLDWTRTDGTRSRVFAFPGVPAEMKDMWEETVRDAILDMPEVERRWILHRRLKCFGVGESEMERRLPDLIRRGRKPLVGITASKATITLRITAEGSSEDACRELIAPTEAIIREKLGELVFGEEDDELEHALARMLAAQNLTIAVIEIETGGVIARSLGQLSADRSTFAGGVVVTRDGGDTSGAALAALAADEMSHARWMEQFGWDVIGADSDSLVRAADQARSMFGTDIGLFVGALHASSDSTDHVEPSLDSTTAHGEPSSSADGSPADRGHVPHIPMALVDGRGRMVARHPIAGHPEIMIPRAAKQAMDLVRRRLMKTAVESNG